MDVEKIQKVNGLARELLKHGRAKTMDDAVQMAEKQLGGGSSAEPTQGLVTGMGDGNQANPVESRPAEESSSNHSFADNRTTDEQAYDRIAFRKLSQQVEQQSAELRQIRMKMNEVITELNNVQDGMKKKAASPVAKQEDMPKAAPKSPDQTQFKPVPKKEPHARSGNYKSEDVDIEKIFYSGNK